MLKKAGFENRIRGCLWSLLKYFCIFLCLCFAYVAIILFARKNACVRLSNGYMIGHPAIFHSNKDLYEMVLRNAEGKILLKTDNWIRYYRHPTKSDIVILEYGDESVEMPGRSMMKLIFDEKHHKRKWNEPDKEFSDDTAIIATDLYLTLKRLEGSKEFRSSTMVCPVDSDHWFS